VDAPEWSPDGSKLMFSMNPQPDTSDGLCVFDMNTHEAVKDPRVRRGIRSRDGGRMENTW
jgi:Tol biopolymer transport system component